MSRRERETIRLRRLLAIAVYRLGGEMKITEDELLRQNWELGMDNAERPTVITGFKGD